MPVTSPAPYRVLPRILIGIALLLLPAAFSQAIQVELPRFSLHPLESDPDGDVILVIGGIQGDEPGGFNAASLLATEYRITRGNVWVIPNLNFPSILQRSRGINGDMNRKFLSLDEEDPDFEVIQKIKQLILDPRVKLILNLHDGSGFYRPAYIDRLHNPARWGQSVIIDQEQLGEAAFGDLSRVAREVVRRANVRITKPDYRYHVKNTRTGEGNHEMAKTLTWFASRHGKAAFGIEASKSFRTHERAWYHLNVVEAFFDLAGVEYERSFELTAAAVRERMETNLHISLYDHRIALDMRNVRRRLGFFPLKQNAPLTFKASNPLMAVVGNGRQLKVRYGNRHVTVLQPQYFDYDSSLDEVSMEVDGVSRILPLGSMVEVADRFRVVPMEGYRVNVIGFRRKGRRDESGLAIRRHDIQRRFSIDRAGYLYRVEFYRGERFCGMVVVRFREKAVQQGAGRPNS